MRCSMGIKPKIPPARRTSLLADSAAGMKKTDIAKKYGLSLRQVRRYENDQVKNYQ